MELDGGGNLFAIMYKYESLLDGELLFGYKNIILYYESEIKNNHKGFNVGNSKLKKYLEENHIELAYENTNNIKNRLCSYGVDSISFFTFTKVTSKGFSKIPSLFYHLRNAFAHNNVDKKTIDGVEYYCLIDLYNDKYTLVGQIPITIYYEFIQNIKESRVK